MAEESTEHVNFEEALKELEALVERMEKGELALEESLQAFERGIALTRHCQTALKAAEQKVEILTREGSEDRVEPFEPQQPE
ncbi:exodeoxyribonuclease VII small subunit [Aquisalimonas asiatica]|uniref:Exodeoxyribonuclease 7 small subunit n=1 Tax=Aquisalimonas asiatica TaxID=406100 RepID=A0A1H8RVI9_9GAMM|nr:exodeoxyribonuclease VII small subunit [Aquisalimonas asiatica]SEO70390.1 Exodeoxyribonuclease VII small subunit [Aquisalimonas asiatica]